MTSLDTLKILLKNSDIRYYYSFAGLWTAFNSYYSRYFEEERGTAPSSDSAAINYLRDLPNSNDLVDSFSTISRMTNDNIQPVINQLKSYHAAYSEEISDSYADYIFDNVVVRFVQFSFSNPIIKEKLWLGGVSDIPSGFKPKKISTRFLPRTEFTLYYRKLQEFYHHNMHRKGRSLQTVLEEFGIKSLGSCIYLDSAALSASSPEARELEAHFTPEMKIFLRSTEQKGLFADVIQMLYVVRNVCIHGEWDNPTEEANKLTLQAAYECLYQILLQFTGEPVNLLHP